jgi:hypothetical protein
MYIDTDEGFLYLAAVRRITKLTAGDKRKMIWANASSNLALNCYRKHLS